MPPPKGSAKAFLDVVRAAVADLSQSGHKSEAQIETWMAAIRDAARRSMMPDVDVEAELKRHFGGVYDRLVARGRVSEYVRGVGRFDVAMVKPQLRAELDRRILASADLIRLNKAAQVDKTVQRFRGWLSSVPVGGAQAIDKREVSAHIAKPTQQARFEMRRVAIDQGHKLAANVADIVATSGGAIAAIWHDRGEHDHNYDARKEHLARSGKVFLIRNSWAIEQGLVRKGAGTYTDQIEMVASEPFCSCWYEYLTSLRDLPPDWLTKKGREAIGL